MKQFLSLIFSICVLTAAAQTLVKGVIIDSDGKPLPGATILEKGTLNGVISDFNGACELSVSSKDVTLLITFVGFEAQEILLESQTRVNVTLAQSIEQLNEVTVQGFAGVIGKSRKRIESIQKVPESVTAFNSKGIENLGINNVANFSNLVPNLRMTESQSAGVNSLIIRGIPQIRNSDAPVAFVIDGVTIPDPSLLNQELFDLALIEVVKGPQGALYGKMPLEGRLTSTPTTLPTSKKIE